MLLVATEQITGYGDVPMSYADLGRRLSMAPRTVRGHFARARTEGWLSEQPTIRAARGRPAHYRAQTPINGGRGTRTVGDARADTVACGRWLRTGHRPYRDASSRRPVGALRAPPADRSCTDQLLIEERSVTSTREPSPPSVSVHGSATVVTVEVDAGEDGDQPPSG